MAQLIEQNAPPAEIAGGSGAGFAALPLAPPGPGAERRVRRELRRQIAALEKRLGELYASTFPRAGIEWSAGALGGPRILGVAELERTRDALAYRLAAAQREVARRGEVEECNRETLERMVADPAEHRWVQISADDVGEAACKHWHVRPRWGLLGLLMNWWRVKLSSGCPLAGGRGTAAPGPFRRVAAAQ